MKVIIINGVNMNQLGKEPYEINGNITLALMEKELLEISKEVDIELDFFQSNIEGEIVNKIHECPGRYDGILLHLGAYSYTSYGILDALTSIHIPSIELMMHNISLTNDSKRKESVILPACLGLITGFGPFVFQLGLITIHNSLIQIKLYKENMEEKSN